MRGERVRRMWGILQLFQLGGGGSQRHAGLPGGRIRLLHLQMGSEPAHQRAERVLRLQLAMGL
jgi:hypothetical protein